MKKIEILTIGAAYMMASACHFLEVDKIGKSDIESFFDSPESVTAAVTGCYSLMNTLTDKYMVLYPEICGDLVTMNAGENSAWSYMYNFDFSESYNASPIGFVWKSAYEIVLNACEIIDYAPSVIERYPQQKSTVDAQVAQAHYLRALATLDLALCYGQHYGYTADASHLGVVVMRSFPNLNASIVRSSAAETYAFILEDLQSAYSLLPEGKVTDVHYASKAAVRALQARVYLYMENWSEALSAAEDVIGNYGFSLTPRDGYFDMFTTVNSKGTETIFSLDGYSESRDLTKAFDYQSYFLLPSQKLTNLFTDSEDPAHPDIRYSLLNYDGRTGSKGCSMKYTILENVADKEKAVDIAVSRLSEMYLIRAEALCRMNSGLDKAAEDIAKLRSRATGLSEAECMPEHSDAAKLLAEVEKERMKELYHEGFRLWDITRCRENLERDAASTSTVKTLTYPNDDFIFPIPGVEIEANTEIQPNPNNETQR